VLQRAERFFQERYTSVDPRTLGLFRICMGVLLLTNLYDRVSGHDLVAFYSNEGILPNHWALFRPPAHDYWSLILGFSTPDEMQVVVTAIAAIYVGYLIGWNTRVMQLLALLAYESLNLRFLIIQHGGNVVVNVLLVWSLFLPLGVRLSVDSLRKSLRQKVERTAAELNARGWFTPSQKIVTFAYACLCLNFAGIYFFNALHKNGMGWREGSIIHWILWQSRMATPLAVWVRMHEPGWLSPMLTWGTLVIEWSIPFLILAPVLQRWTRPIVTVAIIALHLGIATFSVLGPFGWAMMCFGVALLGPADWALALAFFQKRTPHVVAKVDLSSAVVRTGARILARLDGLQRIEFLEGEKGSGFSVGDARGGAALFRVVHALPLGMVWSLPLRASFVADTVFSLVRGASRVLASREVEERPSNIAAPWYWGGAKWFGYHTALTIILTSVISQFWVESWGIPAEWKPKERPAWMVHVIDYLQIPEGWSMFAPDAPREDSRLIADATLANGEHIDLLTGEPVDFELELKAPWGFNQHWCEVHARMQNWPQHWRNFRDYLLRRPRLLGWTEEKQKVIALEVWQVSSDSPPPGSTTPGPIRKKRLFGMEQL
jgi:hypothetical protein